MTNSNPPKIHFFHRIATDYLYALGVVLSTIVLGYLLIALLRIPFALYYIPLRVLWWLFVLEFFNIFRIFYEEHRNLTPIPLAKTKVWLFAFYPFLSGCWILSPWILHPKNKIAANLAISAYDIYWFERQDIDKGVEPAFILYQMTGEPTFLQALPTAIEKGNEATVEFAIDCVAKVWKNRPDRPNEVNRMLFKSLSTLIHTTDDSIKNRMGRLRERFLKSREAGEVNEEFSVVPLLRNFSKG